MFHYRVMPHMRDTMENISGDIGVVEEDEVELVLRGVVDGARAVLRLLLMNNLSDKILFRERREGRRREGRRRRRERRRRRRERRRIIGWK